MLVYKNRSYYDIYSFSQSTYVGSTTYSSHWISKFCNSNYSRSIADKNMIEEVSPIISGLASSVFISINFHPSFDLISIITLNQFKCPNFATLISQWVLQILMYSGWTPYVIWCLVPAQIFPSIYAFYLPSNQIFSQVRFVYQICNIHISLTIVNRDML